MVQFHWSQHLLSNVVLVSFKHSRTFLITMPDGLAIKTFAFSLSPPNSLLIVYGLEFEYEYTEDVSDFFFFNKMNYLWNDKSSNCISCSLAFTCLSKHHVKKMRKRETKETFLDYHHKRNCSLITNRTPVSWEVKRRAIYTTFPHHFALKYGVGRTNWYEQI